MIVLSWPHSTLSPNARGHWRKKQSAKTAYKLEGFASARDNPIKLNSEYHLKITFYPPDKRPRDLDNMFGSLKYALDGIATGWGINDKSFKVITLYVGEVFKGGKVTIEVLNGNTNTI